MAKNKEESIFKDPRAPKPVNINPEKANQIIEDQLRRVASKPESSPKKQNETRH